jgi:hypothetical protein
VLSYLPFQTLFPFQFSERHLRIMIWILLALLVWHMIMVTDLTWELNHRPKVIHIHHAQKETPPAEPAGPVDETETVWG